MSPDKQVTTRKKIEDCALKLFAEKGFSKTTIRDISEAAGVNISAVNYHFESKENLYCSIIREHYLTGAEWLMQILESTPQSPEEFMVRLKTFADFLVQSIIDKPEIHQMMAREMLQGLPHGREVYGRILPNMTTHLKEYMEAAKEKGWLRPDCDCYILALTFIPMLLQPFKNHQVQKEFSNFDIFDPDTRKTYYSEVFNNFFYGILNKEG